MPVGPSAGSTVGGEPPRIPKPNDRDSRAVTAALRRLDACALVDLDAARTAGMPAAAALPMGPHSCLFAPNANYSPGDRGVQIVVGDANSGLFVQYRGMPLTIGGAKAYEYRDYSSWKRCELSFPVSFTRVITFQYESSGDIDTCPVLRRIAEAAVPRLRDPDAITVDTARRPFARWDGCSFLAQILEPRARDHTYRPTGTRDPFSGCETAEPAGPKLEVAYDRAPTIHEPRQVGGRVADVTRYGTSCALTWSQADSGTGNTWFAALVFTLSAADCDTAAQLAERAVHLAGQTPPDATAQPQRPLLYRPDENDTGAVGACVDFPGGRADCEPYHEVPVPAGTERILAAADTNRNVQCAVFIDAVKAHFGSDFDALTWGAHCFFVEPTHTVKIQVNVTPQWPPIAYGADRPDLYTDRRQIRIAGRPAISFWTTSRYSFDIFASPFDDLARPGHVHIRVEALRGRGDGSLRTVRLDPAKAETATQVITQVTERYFAG